MYIYYKYLYDIFLHTVVTVYINDTCVIHTCKFINATKMIIEYV